jgi:hypothetical protein
MAGLSPSKSRPKQTLAVVAGHSHLHVPGSAEREQPEEAELLGSPS